MTESFVETVLGPVPVDRLGVVLPHEHLPLLLGSVSDEPYEREPLEPPDGYVRPLERLTRETLAEARASGLDALVEVTPIGLRRSVLMMQRLSRATGVHVIASTGLYFDGRQPPWAVDGDAEQIRDVFVRELTEGIRDTGVRPWTIKISGSPSLTDQELKAFRAAAAASRATGAVITTHSCRAVAEHFHALVEAGADPSRIYLGHADFSGDSGDHLTIAREGGSLIYTCWGIEHIVPHAALIAQLRDLVEDGRASSVLLSIDYATGFRSNRIDLVSTDYEVEGRNYGYLFRFVLPKLREAGFTEDLLRRFTIDNPRRMLRRGPPPPEPAVPEPAASRSLRSAAPEGRERAPGFSIGPVRQLQSFLEAPDTCREVIHRSLAGWPYTRAVDDPLVAHWQTLGAAYQPERMLLVRRHGCPMAFAHGQLQKDQYLIHWLAVVPGAAEEGAWLLGELEKRARADGAILLRGPSYRGHPFYSGYVLGREPYLPHWAIEATEAFVRAGFQPSHEAVLLVRSMAGEIPEPSPAPAGYEIVPANQVPEFDARVLGYHALGNGTKAAHCYSRLYPNLHSPGGGAVSQIGNVTTQEEHRGKGLATILSLMCLRQLRAWGAAECLVATGLNNPSALRTYEKAGFERRHQLIEWSKSLG